MGGAAPGPTGRGRLRRDEKGPRRGIRGRPDPQRHPQSAPGHRPRRDAGVDRLPRCRARREGPDASALHHAQAHRAGAPAAGRRAVADGDRLHQHDPAGARAVVPRRRGRRARDAPLHPLERRDHGAPRPAPRHRRRRPHLDVRVRRDALRGGHEPLLPRQGPPRRRRPDLLPGPRLPRHVCPQLPRGPPDRGAARRLPPGEEPPRRRQGRGRPVLPAPAAAAQLLGVPDGVDGHRPDERDLPGAVQQVPPQPRHQGHQPAGRLGLPR